MESWVLEVLQLATWSLPQATRFGPTTFWVSLLSTPTTNFGLVSVVALGISDYQTGTSC